MGGISMESEKPEDSPHGQPSAEKPSITVMPDTNIYHALAKLDGFIDEIKRNNLVLDERFFIVILHSLGDDFRQALASSPELRHLVMKNIGHVIQQLGDPELKRAGAQKGGSAKVKSKGVHSADNGLKAQSEEARAKMREAWQRRKERAQQAAER